MAAEKDTSKRCCGSVRYTSPFQEDANLYRQEQAAEAPESLAQETIIENLSPKEAQRLSRVRNIGIAVSYTLESFVSLVDRIRPI